VVSKLHFYFNENYIFVKTIPIVLRVKKFGIFSSYVYLNNLTIYLLIFCCGYCWFCWCILCYYYKNIIYITFTLLKYFYIDLRTQLFCVLIHDKFKLYIYIYLKKLFLFVTEIAKEQTKKIFYSSKIYGINCHAVVLLCYLQLFKQFKIKIVNVFFDIWFINNNRRSDFYPITVFNFCKTSKVCLLYLLFLN
jgi:hypothetical protein